MIVTKAMLEAIAGPVHDAREQPARPSSRTTSGDALDLGAVLRDSGIPVKREHTTSYGTVYDVDCLTSADHDDGACFIQFDSGAVAYTCRHDRCQGKGWPDVKHVLKLLERPGATLTSGKASRTPQTAKGRDRAPDVIVPVYRRMSDVEWRDIEHVWTGYIVRRKFNLFAGYGGVGKGQLMAHLTGLWSRGKPMPYALVPITPDGRPLRTLILAAEDDPHEDIRPRLEANGADLDHVIIFDGIRVNDGDDVRWVNVAEHMPAIVQTVRRERIDVVYFDPISSYMPGVKRQSGGEVRDTLGHVQRLINDTGVTVIATMHLGKAQDRRGAMRILDSVEFVNAARNVLGVNDLPDAYQPDDVLTDEKRGRHKVLAVLKANSTIPGKPLVWSRPLDGAVQWHGESPIGFDESFTDATVGKPLDMAKDFLAEYLKGGSRFQSEIDEAARANDISKTTMRRAKRNLHIVAFKEPHKKSGRWLWKLPDDTEGGDLEGAQTPIRGTPDSEDAQVSTFSPSRDDSRDTSEPAASATGDDLEGAHIPVQKSEHLLTSRPCVACGEPAESGPFSCREHGTFDGDNDITFDESGTEAGEWSVKL